MLGGKIGIRALQIGLVNHRDQALRIRLSPLSSRAKQLGLLPAEQKYPAGIGAHVPQSSNSPERLGERQTYAFKPDLVILPGRAHDREAVRLVDDGDDI